MLINGIVGGNEGTTMTEEADEEEVGVEIDEDAVEIAEGDADDDGNIVHAWFEGPAPLRIGMLGLIISSSPFS